MSMWLLMPVLQEQWLTGETVPCSCLLHIKEVLSINRKYALKAIEKMGANLITAESAIFGFVPNAADPRFKQLQKLLMEPSANTGL